MDVVAIAEVVSTMDRITLELLVMIFVFSPVGKEERSCSANMHSLSN